MTWHLAVCRDCEPLIPCPFLDDEAGRDRWAQLHTEGTGHSVYLTEQDEPDPDAAVVEMLAQAQS